MQKQTPLSFEIDTAMAADLEQLRKQLGGVSLSKVIDCAIGRYDFAKTQGKGKGDRRQLSVRLDDTKRIALEKISKSGKVSMAHLIREALEALLVSAGKQKSVIAELKATLVKEPAVVKPSGKPVVKKSPKKAPVVKTSAAKKAAVKKVAVKKEATKKVAAKPAAVKKVAAPKAPAKKAAKKQALPKKAVVKKAVKKAVVKKVAAKKAAVKKVVEKAAPVKKAVVKKTVVKKVAAKKPALKKVPKN